MIINSQVIIQGNNGLRFFADYTINNCPHIDVLVVPGGKGRRLAMRNEEILDFIKNKYSHIKYLSSVCTGAGVSFGIDVGLYLLSKLFDDTIAQQVADKIEYNWHRQLCVVNCIFGLIKE